MSPPLQVHLFGSLEISEDGRVLPKPATLKSQSLFAYLILHRQTPQHRDHLSELFWGDRSETKARGSLATALWHIRRCLPEKNLLSAEGETVQFDPRADIWVDAEEFESLLQSGDPDAISSGVALFRGDFLSGFYNDWILDERYRLEGLYCSALAELMTEQETAGNAEAALFTARRLLAHDPLREEAYRASMRLCCQLGHRNQALEQYQTCRETILSELGTEPMTETTDLYRAILDGRFQSAPLPVPVSTEVPTLTIPAAGHDPLDVTASIRMVGREAEFAFLEAHWRAAASGQGSMVFLGGEAGVGKTRLVEEFADSLREQGMRVLSGRCYEFERILPYQPLIETLRSALPTLSAGEMDLLPPWFRAGEAGPASTKKGDPYEGPSPDLASLDQSNFFEGVFNFLAALSLQGPLLIVLEDLHWASESTLHLLHYLARRLPKHGILLVCTHRSEEVDERHPLWNFQQTLLKEGFAVSLPLARLSAAAVRSLLEDMSGGGKGIALLSQRLYQETEGNPFFLMETVKALFEEGVILMEAGEWQMDPDQVMRGKLPLPENIRKTVLSRAQRLDGNTRSALYIAAILGREFDFELLERVWGRGEEATLEALDSLLRQRWIEEGTGESSRDYVFAHHKIQEAVYSDIPLQQCKRNQARVGAALERLYDGRLDAMAGEIAYHFEKCSDLDPMLSEKAVTYLLRAGDRARSLFAFQDAVEEYQRALAVLKEANDPAWTARVQMKLGLAYHSMFDFAKAHEAYEKSFAALRAAMTKKTENLPRAPHALRVVVTPEPLDSSSRLDPLYSAEDYGVAMITDPLFSRLVQLTPEMDIAPEIARDWQVLEDGRTYIFHLREDVLWSDGAPLTAADFEFGWKRMLDPTSGLEYNVQLMCDIKGSSAFHQGQIGEEGLGIRALDANTLMVELEQPAAYFLYILPMLPAMPQHVVKALGKSWADPDKIVTCGPFCLESWERGRSLILVRNPAYRGLFPGNVERLEMIAPQETGHLLQLFESDALDVLNIDVLAGEEVTRQQGAPGYTLTPVVSVRCLIFDTYHPPFDDRRVRQAFVLAMDREELVKTLCKNFYLPATGGMVPPGIPGHTAGIALPFDPPRARDLLAEAGYPGGRGFPEVEAWSWAYTIAMHDCLGKQWQKNLGIPSPWKAMGTQEITDKFNEMMPNLTTMGFFLGYPDPDSLLRTSLQGKYDWGNPEYAALVEQARHARDHPSRMQLYRQAEEILIEDVAVVPLYYCWFPLITKPWVKNFTASPGGTWFWKYVILEPH